MHLYNATYISRKQAWSRYYANIWTSSAIFTQYVHSEPIWSQHFSIISPNLTAKFYITHEAQFTVVNLGARSHAWAYGFFFIFLCDLFSCSHSIWIVRVHHVSLQGTKMQVEKENAAHNPLSYPLVATYFFALCLCVCVCGWIYGCVGGCMYAHRNNFIHVYALWDSIFLLYGICQRFLLIDHNLFTQNPCLKSFLKNCIFFVVCVRLLFTPDLRPWQSCPAPYLNGLW